jgi:hypothetical protein
MAATKRTIYVSGAGNSIVNCSLAGSVIAVRPPSQMPAGSKIWRVLAITSVLVLVAAGDVHGVAGMAAFCWAF